MSLSNTPVNTSRTNVPPVARATAMLAAGSQSRLAPNGTRDLRTQAADHGCHRGGDLDADVRRVGNIVLVAEEDPVNAAVLERCEVARPLTP